MLGLHECFFGSVWTELWRQLRRLLVRRAGAGVGVQRGVRGQLVVRAYVARLRRPVARAQPARQRQQRRQLQPLLRRRAEVPSRLPRDVRAPGAVLAPRRRQQTPHCRHDGRRRQPTHAVSRSARTRRQRSHARRQRLRRQTALSHADPAVVLVVTTTSDLPSS